ncbi:MAG: dimethylarginine dimethylaminohydrolase [Hyphomicrobiales bacterium]|nr:MAG: dimethylarginine dimethylaminohydrolase [Hyphomicrobiales bacterium]
MLVGRSHKFKTAITRLPSISVVQGLRDGGGPDPSAENFMQQHGAYVAALKASGARVLELPALEEFPDSVFVEDSALCLKEAAIVLRPGAPSRFGEAALIRPALESQFSKVLDLPGDGFLDGGDVLLSDEDAFIGLSARTNQAGFDALATILATFGYSPVKIETLASILHFKTECGLLDSKTIFSTENLASIGCFENYQVILTPEGEEGAANIVRFNDNVLVSQGYPKSEALLKSHGYNVVVIDTSEPAKIDGGLSCMSLRF